MSDSTHSLPKSIHDHIVDELKRVQPTSVAVVGNVEDELIASWFAAADIAVPDVHRFSATDIPSPKVRVQWALVLDALEHVDAEQGAIILGRLRNMTAPCFSVIVDANLDRWSTRDMVGFGLDRIDLAPPCPEFRVSRYDVLTYKRTPGWFNSDYWANPERWGKD